MVRICLFNAYPHTRSNLIQNSFQKIYVCNHSKTACIGPHGLFLLVKTLSKTCRILQLGHSSMPHTHSFLLDCVHGESACPHYIRIAYKFHVGNDHAFYLTSNVCLFDDACLCAGRGGPLYWKNTTFLASAMSTQSCTKLWLSSDDLQHHRLNQNKALCPEREVRQIKKDHRNRGHDYVIFTERCVVSRCVSRCVSAWEALVQSKPPLAAVRDTLARHTRLAQGDAESVPQRREPFTS